MPYQTYQYAGFWSRFAAYLLDGIFIQIAAFLAGLLMGVILGIVCTAMHMPPDQIHRCGKIAGGVTGVFIGLCYVIFFTAGTWQATPGKRILGIYVVRTDGRPVGLGLSTGRYFAYFLSAVPLSIGFMMIGWTKEKTGIHDLVCKMRVVNGRLS